MPVYQYFDAERKCVVELVKTVAERDLVPVNLKRIPVPERLSILGTSSDPRDPHSAEAQVPKAYRQIEEQTGGREFLKEGGFTVDQVKQAWNF